jgi:hypothetical protein
MLEEMIPAIIEEAQHKIKYGISIEKDCKLKPWSTVGYFLLGESLVNAGRKLHQSGTACRSNFLFGFPLKQSPCQPRWVANLVKTGCPP